MSRFAAISPQTPSVKRKILPPLTATPLPKSRLSDVANVTPTVSSPLAAKSSTFRLSLSRANKSDTPFASRRQPGQLLQTLNAQIELPDLHSIAETGQIPYAVNIDHTKFAFRTMHQTLMGASEGLPSTPTPPKDRKLIWQCWMIELIPW
jgi:DNA polymerase alpha subunit B N-terminal